MENLLFDIEKSKSCSEEEISESIVLLTMENGNNGYQGLMKALRKVISIKVKERDELLEKAKKASDETDFIISGIEKSMQSLR